MKANGCFFISAMTAREVARVDDQHVLPTQPREQQAVRGQREDVIQRDGV